MGDLRSGNPAFNMAGGVFDDWAVADRRANVMTVSGTAVKAVGLLIVVGVTAAVAWTQAGNGSINGGMLIGAAIGGLVLGFATCFKPNWAPVTAPIYAACQGFFLGALSNILNARYPGIAQQAVGATLSTAVVLFAMYATRLVRVTEGLTRFIIAATGALFMFYIVRFVLSFFGVHFTTIQDTSWLSIGISAFAVGIASLNLLLDFDFIESKSRQGAPKSLEWYAAFGLMVTLVWLYIEMLRLLSKLAARR